MSRHITGRTIFGILELIAGVIFLGLALYQMVMTGEGRFDEVLFDGTAHPTLFPAVLFSFGIVTLVGGYLNTEG